MEKTVLELRRELLREQMIRMIGAYSEENWAVGWLEGIDQQIRLEGGLWIAMAAVCGGWPQGYQGEEGWIPLSRDEWAKLHNWTPEDERA
jgi:hypothetical protein